MMPEGHRLRRLQMGEARHRVGGMLGSAVGQGAHDVGKLGVDAVDRVADPKAEIRRHLVVARPPGVQPPPGIADPLGEPRLDVHVDVFEVGREAECPGLDLARDLRQAAPDRRFVIGRENADPHQHGGVGKRAADVLAPHLAVEADRGIYLLHHH